LWDTLTLPMQAFLSSLTAALLFIHTVFGCCWHHAHRCGHDSTAAVSQPIKCCHHQHTRDTKQQEKPCGCKVECEGTCIYVVPQKVKVEAPQSIESFESVAVLPSLAGSPVEPAPSWKAGWSPPDLVPPLRTHLLHQVLLN
jgi:hypothetical protein